MSKMAEAAGR